MYTKWNFRECCIAERVSFIAPFLGMKRGRAKLPGSERQEAEFAIRYIACLPFVIGVSVVVLGVSKWCLAHGMLPLVVVDRHCCCGNWLCTPVFGHVLAGVHYCLCLQAKVSCLAMPTTSQAVLMQQYVGSQEPNMYICSKCGDLTVHENLPTADSTFNDLGPRMLLAPTLWLLICMFSFWSSSSSCSIGDRDMKGQDPLSWLPAKHTQRGE